MAANRLKFRLYSIKYVMRAWPQLGVAKAARAPPCTHPILGRRFHSHNVNLSFLYNNLTSHLILNNYSLDTHFYYYMNKPKHQ